MKKHYAFVPLKESDLKALRKSLIGSLWFRPVFCLLLLVFLAWLGYTRLEILTTNTFCFIVYTLAVLFILSQAFCESRRLHIISRIKKSNLFPLIHSVKGDASFYNEEIANGFIIQIEPVSNSDITKCNEELSLILEKFAESLPLCSYLQSCFGSNDKTLINKAVIYTEIIKDQLDKGNLAILATHDKLVNYVYDKEETS